MNIKQKVAHLKPTLGGKFLYYCLPIRRSVVLSNMHIAFGTKLTPDEIKKLAQCFYSHLFRTFAENLSLSWIPDQVIQNRSKIIGIETPLHIYEKENKGMVFLGGHFGNWEFTPIACILQYQQFRGHFFILRKLLGNKFIEKILFNRFYRVGIEVIPKGNTLNRVLDAIAEKNGVTFVMDQYAKPGRDGIEVEFFGKKAGTFKSLALVASQTDVPVIPTVCYREEDGTHVMRFSKPLKWISDPDPDQEIYKNTLQYNQVLERFVLEHPDQWLWMHKRWKSKPAKRRRVRPKPYAKKAIG